MAAALCLAVALFLGYLLLKGLPTLGLELIFGQADPWAALTGRARVFGGLLPAMAGTLLLVLLSTCLALPVGICSGIYLAEYAGPALKKRLGALFDILAGIPSIVIGLFGFSLAVFLHRHFSPEPGALPSHQRRVAGGFGPALHRAQHPDGPGGPFPLAAPHRACPGLHQAAKHRLRAVAKRAVRDKLRGDIGHRPLGRGTPRSFC